MIPSGAVSKAILAVSMSVLAASVTSSLRDAESASLEGHSPFARTSPTRV